MSVGSIGKSWSGLVLSAVATAFLAQSGGRRIFGVVVGAAIFTWIVSRPRLGMKVMVGIALSASAVLAFMQEMLRYRNVGFEAWWRGETPELAVEHLHVDDNFLRLSQLIHFFPDVLDFVYHMPLLHALIANSKNLLVE